MTTYPAYPGCPKVPGTLSCLDAAYDICQRCPWWTAVAVPPGEELEAELARCRWPEGWVKTDAGWGYDADAAEAEAQAWAEQQKAEIEAENAWLRAAENPPDDGSDEYERMREAHDPQLVDAAERWAQENAEYDPAEDADSELSGGTGWPPSKEEE